MLKVIVSMEAVTASKPSTTTSEVKAPLPITCVSRTCWSCGIQTGSVNLATVSLLNLANASSLGAKTVKLELASVSAPARPARLARVAVNCGVEVLVEVERRETTTQKYLSIMLCQAADK